MNNIIKNKNKKASPESKVEAIDDEIVAVITAAITATAEVGTKIEIKAIKRSKERITSWAKSGLNDILAGRF